MIEYTPEKEAETKFDILRDIDLKSLDRTDDFGKIIDFFELTGRYEEVRDFVLRFVDGNHSNDKLSQSVKGQVANKVDRLIAVKERVLALTKENVAGEGASIINELISIHSDAKEQLNPQLFVVVESAEDLAKKSVKAEANFKKIESAVKKVESLSDKLARFEEQATESAAKSGGEELENDFGTVAASAKKASRNWLISAIVFAVFIFVTVLWGHCLSDGISTFVIFGKNFSISSASISKLLLITLFATGLQFCISNFKTSKHLEVVNSFRARVMNVIERITSSQGMPDDVKSELLSGASSAIFNLNSSGYLKGKDKDFSGISLNLPSAKM